MGRLFNLALCVTKKDWPGRLRVFSIVSKVLLRSQHIDTPPITTKSPGRYTIYWFFVTTLSRVYYINRYCCTRY